MKLFEFKFLDLIYFAKIFKSSMKLFNLFKKN